MSQINPIEPKNAGTNAGTIIKRIISGIIYVLQVLLLYGIGWIVFSENGLEAAIYLIFLVPLFLIATALQIALIKGFMKKIHIGIILVTGVYLIYSILTSM